MREEIDLSEAALSWLSQGVSLVHDVERLREDLALAEALLQVWCATEAARPRWCSRGEEAGLVVYESPFRES